MRKIVFVVACVLILAVEVGVTGAMGGLDDPCIAACSQAASECRGYASEDAARCRSDCLPTDVARGDLRCSARCGEIENRAAQRCADQQGACYYRCGTLHGR